MQSETLSDDEIVYLQELASKVDPAQPDKAYERRVLAAYAVKRIKEAVVNKEIGRLSPITVSGEHLSTTKDGDQTFEAPHVSNALSKPAGKVDWTDAETINQAMQWHAQSGKGLMKVVATTMEKRQGDIVEVNKKLSSLKMLPEKSGEQILREIEGGPPSSY